MAPAPASPVRVLVVEDSPLFREAVRLVIDYAPGFSCIGEAGDGERGVEESLRLQPDLVLIDVRMPGIGGVEAARRILAHAPPPRVILITGADMPPDRVPHGAMTLAKDQLDPAALRRIWERPAST